MTSASRIPRRRTSTDVISRLRALLSRSGSFAAIGLIAFVVDIGVYNALRFTILDDKPIGAKVISVAVAMVVAWIGNRYLTFRDARTRPVWQGMKPACSSSPTCWVWGLPPPACSLRTTCSGTRPRSPTTSPAT
jgi:hypothetical protein